jgi:membrane protein YdbS with pleckstrin-like domain
VAYHRQFLNDDERIVFDRHPHWSFLLGAAAMVTGGLIVFIAILIIEWQFAWIGLLVLALTLLGSVGRFLRWRTTEFVLTTARLIVRQGILSKHGIEIPLDRIMNISYHQTLLERLLRTGDLVVESAGEDGRQTFTDVSDPAQVQNLIYKTAEEDERGIPGVQRDGLGRITKRVGGGDDDGGSQLSVPEQIEKLAELRDRGVLSPQEFEESKRNLLDDL